MSLAYLERLGFKVALGSYVDGLELYCWRRNAELGETEVVGQALLAAGLLDAVENPLELLARSVSLLERAVADYEARRLTTGKKGSR